MANLPTEKVNELKQLIHNHLNQMDVNSKIKDYLDESFVSDERNRSVVEEETILTVLRERGLVDEVMKSLKFEGTEARNDGHRRPKAEEHRETQRNVEGIAERRGEVVNS